MLHGIQRLLLTSLVRHAALLEAELQQKEEHFELKKSQKKKGKIKEKFATERAVKHSNHIWAYLVLSRLKQNTRPGLPNHIHASSERLKPSLGGADFRTVDRRDDPG
jgi:hypothetical protein